MMTRNPGVARHGRVIPRERRDDGMGITLVWLPADEPPALLIIKIVGLRSPEEQESQRAGHRGDGRRKSAEESHGCTSAALMGWLMRSASMFHSCWPRHGARDGSSPAAVRIALSNRAHEGRVGHETGCPRVHEFLDVRPDQAATIRRASSIPRKTATEP
jgi:hypothetical protein